MSVAIVAYPTVSEDDRHWIEQIRAQHDPQSQLIRAHFTLVFPAAVNAAAVNARAVLGDFEPIRFVSREARAVPDVFRRHGGHVFLVPEEGAGEIVVLHRRLSSGILAPHLHEEIPFVPHLTVAAKDAFEECEKLAQRLNEEKRVITGGLSGLEIIEIVDGVLTSRGALR